MMAVQWSTPDYFEISDDYDDDNDGDDDYDDNLDDNDDYNDDDDDDDHQFDHVDAGQDNPVAQPYQVVLLGGKVLDDGDDDDDDDNDDGDDDDDNLADVNDRTDPKDPMDMLYQISLRIAIAFDQLTHPPACGACFQLSRTAQQVTLSLTD